MRRLIAPLLTLLAVPAFGAPADRQLTLEAGTAVPLTTTADLSSNTVVKGSVIQFRVAADVVVDGTVVIAKDTDAVGQVIDARDRGMAGMSGKLSIRPLYLRVRGAVVRLTGAIDRNMGMSAGGAASIVLNPFFFTGHTARIPAGTAVPAQVEKTVTVTIAS